MSSPNQYTAAVSSAVTTKATTALAAPTLPSICSAVPSAKKPAYVAMNTVT